MFIYSAKNNFFLSIKILNFKSKIVPTIMNTALILDNDLYFTSTVKMFFSRKNIDSIVCNDGNQALEALNTMNYDFVICSDQINHKGGLEMASLAKNKTLEKNIPFILVTNSNNPAMMESFEELQPDAVFHKPIDILGLLTTISNLQLNQTQNIRIKI